MAKNNEVLVKFKGDNSDLKKSSKQAKDDIKGLGDESKKTEEDIKKPGEQAPKTEKKVSGSFAKATAAVAGLAAAAVATQQAMSAISFDFDANTAVSKVTAALNLTEGQSKIAGDVAGELYSQGFGESIGDLGTTIDAVMSSFGKDLSSKELTTLTTQVENLARAFDVDVAEATASASVLISNGLAKDGTHAMDLLTTAMQNMPAGVRAEALPALSEYSKSFAQLGLTGEQAISLLAGAAENGVIGVDKMGDAVKEFTIRSTDMSTGTQEAYKKIGVSSKEMTNAFLEGGPAASKAMSEVVAGLQGIKDPGEQAAAAIALFGTPLEDLGTDKIPEFLASMSGADGSLGDVAGSAEKLGEQLGNNSPPMEMFNRILTQTVSEVLQPLIPYLQAFADWAKENPDKMKILSMTILGLGVAITLTAIALKVYKIATGEAVKNLGKFIVHLKNVVVWLGQKTLALVRASGAALRVGAVWVAQAVRSASAWVASSTKIIVSSAKTATKSTASAIKVGAVWVAQATKTSVAWAKSFAVYALGVAKTAMTTSLAAIKMAASWLIALGPIGLIVAAVGIAVALIIANWDKVKNAAVAVWNWIWVNVIKRVIDWVVAYFNMVVLVWTTILTTVKDTATRIWNTIKNTITGVVDKVKQVWNGIVNWFKGIWDKITKGATTIKDSISGAFTGAVDTAKEAFKKGINWIIDKINVLIKGANKVAGVLGKVTGTDLKISEIAKVAEGGYVSYASGGAVRGRGTATSDSIPAMLSNGEFVLRASAVKELGVENVSAMNEGKSVQDAPVVGQIVMNENADPLALAQQIGAMVRFA